MTATKTQAERAVIKHDQPDTPNSEVCKRLGERWNASDADTKAKYATIHAENHVEAMRVYAADTKDLGAIV